MGLLLMQFEYNRAKQKQTVLEHEGIRLNQKHELYTKRIGKITEQFNKKKTALDSKYTRIKSELSAQLNYASANGIIGETNVIGSIFSSVSSRVLQDIAVAGQTDIQSISNPATTDAGAAGSASAAGATATITTTSETAKASSIASQKAAIVAQLQSALQVILDQLKEVDLENLEAEEDALTAPIADKDTEIQSKISVNETLTTMADQRVESAKSRLAQVAKDSVAHYGLS